MCRSSDADEGEGDVLVLLLAALHVFSEQPSHRLQFLLRFSQLLPQRMQSCLFCLYLLFELFDLWLLERAFVLACVFGACGEGGHLPAVFPDDTYYQEHVEGIVDPSLHVLLFPLHHKKRSSSPSSASPCFIS